MMIFFIIAVAIIVILLCRETILHKGDFFERAINPVGKRGNLEGENSPLTDLILPHLVVDGTLPGDPLYTDDS